MTLLYIIIGIFVGATIAFVIFSLIFKKNKPDSDLIAKELNKSFPDILKKASEQLILMADQKLGAEKKEIKWKQVQKKMNEHYGIEMKLETIKTLYNNNLKLKLNLPNIKRISKIRKKIQN